MATAGHSWFKLRGSSDGKWAPKIWSNRASNHEISASNCYLQQKTTRFGYRPCIALIALSNTRTAFSVLRGAPLEVHRAWTVCTNSTAVLIVFQVRTAGYWQVVIELAKKFWEWSPELWRGYWLVTCRCLLAGRSIFRNSSISVCACILVQQSTTQTLYRVIDRTFVVSKKLRAFTLTLNGMRRI